MRKVLSSRIDSQAAGSPCDSDDPPRWGGLPDGILHDIFQRASPQDLARLGCVVPSWQHVANDAALWRRHAEVLRRSTTGLVPELKSVCRHALLTEANLLAGRATAQSTVRHGRFVWDICWSHDGSRLATVAGDRTARIVSASGVELVCLKSTGRNPKLSWSPDDSKLALFGETTRIFHATSGTELVCVPHTDRVTKFVWSPDSTRVATASYDDTVRITDATSGDEHVCLEARSVHGICWSADGSKLTLAVYSGTACVIDATRGTELSCMSHPSRWGTGVSLSSDGSKAAFALSDGPVHIADVMSGAELTRIEHTGGHATVCWSVNDHRVALGWADGTARIIYAMNWAESMRFSYTSRVKSFCWSPDDSKVASELNDLTVRIMDVARGDELARIDLTHMAYREICWSPDSSKIVVMTPPDHTTRIRNATTGAELARVEHAQEIGTFCWSADGSKVASGSLDSTVRIIDFGPAPATTQIA